MKKFIQEFRTFISRGNVLDMAVGVIIGSALTSIVSSISNDIIMPIVGIVIGGVDFTSLSVVVGGATVRYGAFIQNIVNFLLIALCVFIFIKVLNKLTSFRFKTEPEAKTKKDPSVELLKEIRDLLVEKNAE
ncbi:MAG: large-conductance mechanosensitive channel protein MscL [Clostridiales bacterium]|nr:large-conductance mechanosensitive channel protein MscL [Clostridiales bacterium]